MKKVTKKKQTKNQMLHKQNKKRNKITINMLILITLRFQVSD